MAVFTFSTKGSKPADTAIIEEVKQHCEDRGINFSALVVKLLILWHKEEVKNGK
jgi:hypothetical protein